MSESGLKLSDLDFSDLYVRLDSRDPSRYSPLPRRGAINVGNKMVPYEFEPIIDVLRNQMLRHESNDFSFALDDMRLRASRCKLFEDQTWVALRRLPVQPPILSDLNFRTEIMNELRSWGTRNGLIIIGGATRAGKTTTAVGLLAEFLHSYGGVAFTIEDPVEYYLQGEQGKNGYCFQCPVHEDQEWGESVKTALRWAPRYIFLGEVRTPAAAKWLLRAATSGHLAICTIHGGSIEETLSALLQIAQTELGETASMVLADGLCAVVHQTLVNGRPSIQILSTTTKPSDAARTAIRSGKLQTLGTFIEQQSALRSTNQSGGDDSGKSSSGQGGQGGQSGSQGGQGGQGGGKKRFGIF